MCFEISLKCVELMSIMAQYFAELNMYLGLLLVDSIFGMHTYRTNIDSLRPFQSNWLLANSSKSRKSTSIIYGFADLWNSEDINDLSKRILSICICLMNTQ